MVRPNFVHSYPSIGPTETIPLQGHGATFDDDEGDDEEEGEEGEDADDLASIGSSHHSTASASAAGGGLRSGSGALSPAPGGARSPTAGFGSPVRTFSQGALSSVSDASGHKEGQVAAGAGAGTAGGDDEDDKEGEGEEGEEDDGFGALNISADRLPAADTALSRFLKRALANNGEAAAIAGLKASLEEAIAMPRPEAEILEDLDKRFYEPEFDPTRAVLVRACACMDGLVGSLVFD